MSFRKIDLCVNTCVHRLYCEARRYKKMIVTEDFIECLEDCLIGLFTRVPMAACEDEG